MNKEIEEIIVKSFFEKRLQKRVLFELTSPKKRSNALDRLNHNYLITLRKEFLIEIAKPNSDPYEIEKIMRKQGAGNSCYVMSCDSSLDGKELPTSTAIEQLIWYQAASIISFIPGKLAYFQAELDYGFLPRFILKSSL
ncbi:hypothetical protein [Niallia sp. Man26]|uniref:hypothetical protein n=1 Tax=Niallia TaxID=2837506 RepID=UPI001ED9E644|nr:hypothetical protein [Niallia sp. Man26]UPO91035.1 hypothetical protein L8T27_027265 [Niallia sp. Man26]